MTNNNKYNVRDLMVDNYWRKTIDEIIDWYPKLLDKDTLFKYLVQTKQYDRILSIAKYNKILSKHPRVTTKNDDAYWGFFDLLISLEELTFRQIILFYYSEDWIAESAKIVSLRKRHVNYEQFNDFYQQVERLHWITPSEYEEYIQNRTNSKYSSGIKNTVKKWYYDYSLYLKIDKDKRYSDVEKFKKILTPYDAQFGYIFLYENMLLLEKAKLYSKRFIYENLYITILPIN